MWRCTKVYKYEIWVRMGTFLAMTSLMMKLSSIFEVSLIQTCNFQLTNGCNFKSLCSPVQQWLGHHLRSVLFLYLFFVLIYSLFYIYSPQECGCSLVGEAARECELVQEATKRCWGLSDLKIGWAHVKVMLHKITPLIFQI